MTSKQMLSNLVISIGIFFLGFWLKGLDSIFAKIGGWVLVIFAWMAIWTATKWFIQFFKYKRASSESFTEEEMLIYEEYLSEIESLSIAYSKENRTPINKEKLEELSLTAAMRIQEKHPNFANIANRLR